MVLNKKAALYERDEQGELLPMEVELEIDDGDVLQAEYEGEKVKVIPIPRGKIKRFFARVDKEGDEKDFDGQIILEHCVDPSFDEKEIEHIKPALAQAIVNTIFRESGIRVGKNRKKAILEAEDDFAKN